MRRMTFGKHSYWVVTLTGVLLISMTGCFIKVKEKKSSDPQPYTSSHHYYSSYGTDSSYSASNNTSNDSEKSLVDNSCESMSKKLPVNVHYDLNESLGNGRVVVIEAFDNSYLNGLPVAEAIITNYDARQKGNSSDTEIELEPGTYYLRAHIRKDEPLNKPLGYQDLELAAQSDRSIWGATSVVVSVELEKFDRYAVMECNRTPANLYLDQLFIDKDQLPGTNARIRIKMALAEGFEVADRKKVLVELRDDDDFAYSPVYQFTLQSELFLIEGRARETEFVSPELDIGRYTLLVFIDANDNGFLDVSELAAIFERADEPALIKIEQNRTETVSMTLSPYGE